MKSGLAPFFVQGQKIFLYLARPSYHSGSSHWNGLQIFRVLVPDSRWSQLGKRCVEDVPPKMPSRDVQIDHINEIATNNKLNQGTIDKLEENLRYVKSMLENKDKKRRKLVIVRPLVYRSRSALACMQSTAATSCGREQSSSSSSLRQSSLGQRSWYSF